MSPRWNAIRVAVLPGVLAVLGIVELVAADAPRRALAGAALVAGCALLTGRKRHPLLCGSAAGLLALAVPWVGPELDEVTTIALVLIVSFHALGRWVPDLRGLVGAALLLAAIALTYTVVDERAHSAGDAVLVLALAAPPYVVGRIARRLADDNDLLRREQELLRRRAVRDERDRISRELHDVVAHSISAMVAQVVAADDLLTTSPGRAEELLDRAAETGRAALRDTGRLLRLLRDSDDELGLAPGPTQGSPLAQTDDLVGGRS